VHRDSEVLARFLLDPDGPPTVGVLAEKGYFQMLAATAIMKAGTAYVPMNVEWPLGRIGEVLAQAGVRTVLMSRAQYERAQGRLPGNLRLLVIEDLLTALPAKGALPEVAPDDVAYVVFTSGSTGKPKGVTISHRGAVNTILAVNERLAVMPRDRVLALSELSFDLSVYDIFGMLAAGGTIVFPRQEDTKNPACWLDLVRRHGVTIWNSVPQLASLLVDEAGEDAAALATLRVFMLSGDWIPTSLPNKIRALTSDATVMSLGGATEGTIWSIWYDIGEVDQTWASIPYGVAMPNQGMYVLNAHGEHCPVGVTGEIHIGGMGVALNYWRDASLTAERYTVHPELGRLYRTGDLGRWSRDGYIEFLGRNDFQVKLNGYRVELGEIESALAQLPGIDRAVVRIQRSQAHDDLVGYLVPSTAQGRLVEPGDPELDKQEFLLSSTGVRRDVTPSHQLHLAQDPDGYALAKSYRRFLGGEVDPTLLRKHFTEILSADTTPDGSMLDSQGWSAVLGRLAAVFLPGRALPKYRFPSAGSAYPVRTYVTTAALSGRYYHDPLTHQLCVYDQLAVTGDADEIALVVHWPAITPLYGNRARELALLEVGHMLSLLTQALGEQGVRCEVSTGEQRLDADNSVVCRIIVGRGPGRFTPRPLGFACFLRDEDRARYAEQGGTREYDLNQLPLFDRVSDVYAILRDARCAVILESAGDTATLVSAGYLFQRLRERLHADGLGTCVLGLPLTARGVYTMVVGPVDRDALRAPEIQADRRELTRAVNEELAKALPDYMLPSRYLVLDELPLSANGKVALDQLPEVESVGGYVPPSSAVERILAQTWAGVLGSDPESISVAASFFAVGGDSLSAVKLFRVMQRDLGLDLRLRDLYQHDTIAKLADYVSRR
jgi:amino acid adenylation domain-containing protein